MTTIAQNPTVCCPTCADFPQCQACNGGASLMKLSVTIEGAPNDSYQCLFCPGYTGGNRRIMWSNLDGTYELEQDYAGSSSFHLDFVGDCANVQDSDAILIEDNESGCCTGENYDELFVSTQMEIYVSGIYVSLECVNDEMRIAGIAFGFCLCSRIQSFPSGPWGDWSCDPFEYPGVGEAFICGLEDHVATASPCSGQLMQRELLWPPVLQEDECNFYFVCDDPMHPPTVSQLKAQLAC